MYDKYLSFVASPFFSIDYTVNNIGYLKGTFKYHYHATPGKPFQGSGCMVIVLKGSF